MIVSEAFEGLRYVNDDEESLQNILMISLAEGDIDLKFKNAEPDSSEQGTLQELLTMVREELRPMIMQQKEDMPEAYDLILNASKK